MSIAWFIFITFLFLIGQSFIFKKWGFSRVTYSRFFNKEAVFVGEEIEMVDELINRKLLPIPWIRLESRMDPSLRFLRRTASLKDEQGQEGFHKTLFSLSPYQKITRRHRIQVEKRGVYHLEKISMTLGDLIGFTNFHKSVLSEARVVVYPKLLPIDQLPLPAHSLLGELIVKRWIMEDPFIRTGVRDYAYGDPLRQLNWKATARTGRLQVSKNDYTADHFVMIYVNLDEGDDPWMPILNKDLAELKLSYAASIATFLISKGMSTGFGCNADLVQPFGSDPIKGSTSVRLEPSARHHHLTQIYDTVAKVSLDQRLTFQRFLKEDIGNRYKTDLIILTSHHTEALQNTIRILEHQGNTVNLIRLSDNQSGIWEEGERQHGIQIQ